MLVMGNDIRDSTGKNEEHSSLNLSVYSTFNSKLDKTDDIYIYRVSQKKRSLVFEGL